MKVVLLSTPAHLLIAQLGRHTAFALDWTVLDWTLSAADYLLHCSPHCTLLHCTLLHCTLLHCTLLYLCQGLTVNRPRSDARHRHRRCLCLGRCHAGGPERVRQHRRLPADGLPLRVVTVPRTRLRAPPAARPPHTRELLVARVIA
jgi:hypothetical protein